MSVLKIGIPITKTITTGLPDSCHLQLNAQDLAKILVETDDLSSAVRIFSTDGVCLRQFPGNGFGTREIFFVADKSGQFRIEIQASAQAVSDRFVVLLEKVISLDERLAPPTLPESELVEHLRRDLLKDREFALENFWKTVEKTGTPVFEVIKGDEEHALCTFVWRGDANTRSVLVSIPPYSRINKENFIMARVGETDVWVVTVKLPARSRFLYSLVINTPYINAGPTSRPEENEIFRAASQADPLNPLRLGRHAEGGQYEARSIFEPPGAKSQPWLLRSSENRSGKVERFSLKSRRLENERAVSVYTPPDYSPQSRPLPILVLFDEDVYVREIEAAVILDNLIAQKRIPPLVAVFVGAAPGSRGRELACNPRFVEFVSEELLRWAADAYNITHEPERSIIGGASLGGLTAVFTALHRPDLFGNVLSQSGSFWWKRSQSPSGSPAASDPTAIVSLALEKPLQKLRFYLDAGADEIELPGHGLGILNANRNLRDVLRAKGYEVFYQEFAGGHGSVNWRGTLGDGLIALTKNIRDSSS